MAKKRIFSLILCLLLALGTLAMASCGPTGGDDKDDQGGGTTTYTVTFDLNYEGAPAASTQTVDAEDAAVRPENPTRENYTFTDWFYDAACTEKVEFEEPIESNITFYAGWTRASYVITFNSMGGSAVESMTVNVNAAPSQPQNPTRDGYIFSAWYTDEACTQRFDFSAALTADITLYAGWTEVSEDSDIATVTYNYNYEGAPNGGVYLSQQVEKNTRPTKPGDPTRAADEASENGYQFNGWFTDAALTEAFDFDFTPVTEDTTLYAKWNKIYIFEAEYTELDGKQGVGYSSGASGTDMIVQDVVGDIGASNGYWVSYLYYNGAFLEFKIDSDKAVDDATLDLRLSVEFYDFTLAPANFSITVNGEALRYSSILLDGAINSEDIKRPFQDYKIATGVDLKEGENIIRLTVTNTAEFEIGTMQAYAPLIDCMYIGTDANLTWSPYLTNIPA